MRGMIAGWQCGKRVRFGSGVLIALAIASSACASKNDDVGGEAPAGKLEQKLGAPGVTLFRSLALESDQPGVIDLFTQGGLQSVNTNNAPLVIAAGEVNNDGVDDIAVGTASSFGGGSVGIYSGSGLIHPYPQLNLAPFQAGNVLRMGDFDNDGSDELFVGDHEPIPTNGNQEGQGILAFSKTGGLRKDFFPEFPSTPQFRSGNDFVVCDLNNDGFEEVIVVDSAWRIYTHPSVTDTSVQVDNYFGANKPAPNFGHTRLACADLNNDDYEDLIIGRGDGSCLEIVTHPSRPPITFDPAESNDCARHDSFVSSVDEIVAGDLNDDGFAEIVIGHVTSAASFGGYLETLSSADHPLGNYLGNNTSFGMYHSLAIGRLPIGALLDTDDDGIPDVWEINGVDINNDGCIELDLPAMGANRYVKDLFVEIDAMDCNAPGSDCAADALSPTHNHLPSVADLAPVVQAFRDAPYPPPPGAPPGTPSGVTLHVSLAAPDVDLVTHTNICDMGKNFCSPADFCDALPGSEWLRSILPCEDMELSCFDEYRMQFFGTANERAGIGPACAEAFPAEERAQQLLGARAAVFHYNLWGHRRPSGSSGVAEGASSVDCPDLIGHGDIHEPTGNDVFVSLYGFTDQDPVTKKWVPAVNGSATDRAGTFMHELGHNLGLNHGGGDEVNRKPNYLSIMNYAFQGGIPQMPVGGVAQPPRFDYSRQILPSLDETNLDEAMGIQGPIDLMTSYTCPTGRTETVPAFGSIDWNCDPATATSSTLDINDDRWCILPGGNDLLDSNASSSDHVSDLRSFISAGPDGFLQSAIAHAPDPNDTVSPTFVAAGPDFLLATTPIFDDVTVNRIDPGAAPTVIAIPAVTDDVVGHILPGTNGVLEPYPLLGDDQVGPNSTVVAGNDGILQTRVSPTSDDQMVVLRILPGSDLTLETVPALNDQLQAQLILAGPNGNLDSGMSLPGVQPGDTFNGAVITPDADAILQTARMHDDVIIGRMVSDGQNRVCETDKKGDDEYSYFNWQGRDRESEDGNDEDAQPNALHGYNDWENIKLKFTGSGNWNFGVHNSIQHRVEPTAEDRKKRILLDERADLSLTATSTPASVSAGSSFTYQVTIANAGPSFAESVRAALVLSAPAVFTSCTTSTGASCTGSGNSRSIALDGLGIGGSVNVTLVASLDGCGFESPLELSGSVSSAVPDAQPSNDGLSVLTPVVGSAPQFVGALPEVTISSCTNVSLPAPAVKATCGSLTLTNDRPAKFPLGRTVVTWTATSATGGSATATQVVTALLGDDTSCCPAGTNIILGTSNNNTLNGTSGSDCILGRGAQDTIYGNGGVDYISGGEGNDTIYGGDGNDHLFGGTGQDALYGQVGNDTLYGGDGDDRCYGGNNSGAASGSDTLYGGQGQDQLFGEDGDDWLYGQDGDDPLNGGPGNDYLEGGRGGNDQCNGGTGSNLFSGCETAGLVNACTDGVKNGGETALDCGGGGCTGCGGGLACNAGTDCLSGVCSGGVCQAPLGPVQAALYTTADWGAGYCVAIEATNVSGAPLSNWSVLFDTNQSTISSVSQGTASALAGTVRVSPGPGFTTIAPGATRTGVGFCANRGPTPGVLPKLYEATGTP